MTNERYARLGLFIATVRLLERFGYEIARGVAVLEPERLPFSQAASRARHLVNTTGVPPWAEAQGVTSGAVMAWFDEVDPLMEYRNAVVHWTHALVMTPEGLRPFRESSRTGERAVYEEDEIVAWTETADRLMKDGSTLAKGFLLPVGVDGGSEHPTLALKPQQRGRSANWPAEPTDKQIEQWHRDWFNAPMPLGWAGWPRARLVDQMKHRR